MTKAGKDMGASVRARLLRLARERGDDFQLLLTRYANERLLYRLAASRHSARFVLKGAALFMVWTGKSHRATRDLDLLGFGDPSENHVRSVFADIIALDVLDDGVFFDPASVDVGPIREDQEYGGVRVNVAARIASAQIRLQVDVGFGDVITPEATMVAFPALLDLPAPHLLAYPPETVVAEKIEAMVQLGLVNSRMKDLYDVALLSRLFSFHGAVLVRAIRATFARRKSPLPAGLPVTLTPAFTDDPAKKTQWTAFVRKTGARDAGDLQSTAFTLTQFIAQPLIHAASSGDWEATWPPGGPWQASARR